MTLRYSEERGVYMVANEACERGAVLLDELASVGVSRLAKPGPREGEPPVSALKDVPWFEATPERVKSSFYIVQQLLEKLCERAIDTPRSAGDVNAVVQSWASKFAQAPSHDMTESDVEALRSHIEESGALSLVNLGAQLSRQSVEAVARVVRANLFGLRGLFSGTTCGEAFFEAAARANHSCRPTALQVTQANRMRLVALVPLKRGDEVTISYVMNLHFYDTETRREELRATLGFTCRCDACANGDESGLCSQMKRDLGTISRDDLVAYADLSQRVAKARKAEEFVRATELGQQEMALAHQLGAASFEREAAALFCSSFIAQHSGTAGGILRVRGSTVPFGGYAQLDSLEFDRIKACVLRKDGLEGWTTSAVSRLGAMVARALFAYGNFHVEAEPLGDETRSMLALAFYTCDDESFPRILDVMINHLDSPDALRVAALICRRALDEARREMHREIGEEATKILFLGDVGAYGIHYLRSALWDDEKDGEK